MLLAFLVICFGGPFVILLTAAFVAYYLEGRPRSWQHFKTRFRLKPIRGQQWFWTVGLIIFSLASFLLLRFTARWIASIPLFAPPDFLPTLLDPRVVQTDTPLAEMMGVPLRGNWWVFFTYFGVLCFNIFGEELWWRGYILPRQELTHGKWAWLIHGLLWDLFHLFFWWNLIALLPSTLAISYVTSRFKNTTVAIVAHWGFSGANLVIILLGVLGMG
ncbi:MAG: CPBP family intramembrane glutamic endopeptidase [Cyanobacteria bacterium J06635_1]